MTKTFNKIKVGIGLAALATLFAFNLHHAVVYHYGVLNLNFSQHPQVYAQTNSAGNGGKSAECVCWYAGGNTANGHAWWCPAHPNNSGGGSPIPPTLVQYRVTGEGVIDLHITRNLQGQVVEITPIFGDCCKYTGNKSDWCDTGMIIVCLDPFW